MIRTGVFLAIIASTYAAQLSSFLREKCPEGGQESAACYSKQLTDLVQGLSKGNPELGFDVMDPFVTGPLNLSVNAGSDQFRMNFLSPNFTGLAKAYVTNMVVGNPLEFTLNVPVLKMYSPYVNSGRLIIIKASGGGAMTNTFEDVSLRMKVPYAEETRDGKRFATVSKVEVRFASKKSNMRVAKLNSGNAIALELYNVFLSSSSQEILGLMLPQFNQKFSEIFTDTAQRMVKNLPLDELFA